MTCKQFINAVNVAGEALLANEFVPFTQVVSTLGENIQISGVNTNFSVKGCGLYKLTFDADVVVASTGEIQILNNGTVIPGAVATASAGGAATNPEHIHIQGTFKVLPSCKCVQNTASIQVQALAAMAATNISIIIERI